MDIIVDDVHGNALKDAPVREVQVMPPRPLVIAVKKALGRPVFGLVRYPRMDRRQWHYQMERIA